ARQVVNATGPWVDEVRRLAGTEGGGLGGPRPEARSASERPLTGGRRPTSTDEGEPLLRPTKGVHVVAPGRGLSAAFLLLHPADGRVFFVLPWMGKTLLGTTDADSDEPPDRLHVAPAEVAYLLEGHNYYFEPELKESDL